MQPRTRRLQLLCADTSGADELPPQTRINDYGTNNSGLRTAQRATDVAP